MSDNAQPRSEPESAAFSQAIRIVFLALEGCGTLNHQGEPISSSPAPAPYGENGGSPGSEGPPGNVRRGPGEAAISEDNAVPSNGKDEAEIRQEHGKLRVRLLKVPRERVHTGVLEALGERARGKEGGRDQRCQAEDHSSEGDRKRR